MYGAVAERRVEPKVEANTGVARRRQSGASGVCDGQKGGACDGRTMRRMSANAAERRVRKYVLQVVALCDKIILLEVIL